MNLSLLAIDFMTQVSKGAMSLDKKIVFLHI